MGFIAKLQSMGDDFNARRAGKADASRFLGKYPELARKGLLVNRAMDELREVYAYYKRDVSPGNSAISLTVAAFISAAARLKDARCILDLGSGFSSFAFRRDSQREVTSVDSDPYWLERTGEFLCEQGVDDARLLTWEAFDAIPDPGRFDLIFVDIRPIARRVKQFERFLSICSPEGVLIYDDYQKKHLRKPMRAKLGKLSVECYNLMELTIDETGRYDAWIEAKTNK